MKITSFNVNGIRASEKKGFLDWLQNSDSDLVFIQETKAQPEQLKSNLTEPHGWQSQFHSAQKKGYSGVAVYYKTEPDEIIIGLGIDTFDHEGRAIAVRYDDLMIWGTYFPNGGQGPHRVKYKLDFYHAMLQKMNEQREAGMNVIVTGDYNTAHQETDLARPKENRKTSGFLPEERVWIDRYIDEGWLDIFRSLNPDARDVYTWWNMRTRARERNVGWRIDYFFCNESYIDQVIETTVETDCLLSDHAPIHLSVK